jgi:hypothetical protein
VPAVLPFFHIYGLVCVLLGSLAHGCKIVTLPKFEPKSFFKLLDQHQVLLVLSNIPTACFSQQYKYLSVILSNLTELFIVTFSESHCVYFELGELMTLCLQVLTSLCSLYKVVAWELKFLPYKFFYEKILFVETHRVMFVLYKVGIIRRSALTGASCAHCGIMC